jgi:two-component system sensor histidine kinase KdpD
MARGKLIVYLGAAPGVGKTYAMLGEGHRRQDRGTDVVVAFAEAHGRARTAALLEGLRVVPRATIEYRGAAFTEMDLDAALKRHPKVALVDELAHTNVPGSRNAKRWQDVEELLDAGINVIATVNIQHLESLNDVVQAITGVEQRETIPDAVVRRADQIELVDMSPDALRRRMAHGNVYPPEKIDAALSHFFRVGNLDALRELALLWLADRVDEDLEEYREQHGIASTWPARERIVVALTGGPEGETLIRRGARLAAKGAGSEMLALYVTRGDGLTGAGPKLLEQQRALTESLGGTFHNVVDDDVPHAVLEFARGVNASQIVIGESRRTRLSRFLSRGVGATIVRESGDIDVLMVTHEHTPGPLRWRPSVRLPPRRLLVGWVLAVLGPAALGALLAVTRDMHGLPTELMLFLSLAVVVALVGGLWPAVVAAVSGSLIVNYFFTPPLYTLTIDKPENAFAVGVFLLVAVAVAVVVDRASRRAAVAARARREADTLFLLSGAVLRGEDTVEAMLRRLRETFGVTSAVLLERPDEHTRWHVVAASGPDPCRRPEEGDAEVSIDERLALALRGRPLTADDMRVVNAFAAQLAVLVERSRLRTEAAQAERRAANNAVRTTLLAAVSHDLRTPLATIKANVSGLLAGDVVFSDDDRRTLLGGIATATDDLDRLVGNLLDMSRLRTGSVRPLLRRYSVAELLEPVLSSGDGVHVEVAPDVPEVYTDAGLLERVLANVIENAVRHSPAGTPVVVAASAYARRVEIRVVDRGPGLPPDQLDRIFEPFQRLGDVPAGNGVGLGLAVARGFAVAVGGQLIAEETPGGGLTLVLSLPTVLPDADAVGQLFESGAGT